MVSQQPRSLGFIPGFQHLGRAPTLKGLRAPVLLAAAFLYSGSASASYFGINTLDRGGEDWRVFETEHLKVHLYGDLKRRAPEICELGERSYAQAAKALDFDATEAIPVFVYPSGTAFAETNIIDGPLGEGVGGFTEAFKNRVALPFDGSLKALEDVASHELTHALQYCILYGETLRSLKLFRSVFVPTWVMEGMAEHVSRDWDPAGEMVLRDALLHDLTIPLDKLDSFTFLGGRTYLAYKEGQSVMDYISAKRGEEHIADFMKKYSRQWGTGQILRGIFNDNQADPLTGEIKPKPMDEARLYKEWLRESKEKAWAQALGRGQAQDYGPEILAGGEGRLSSPAAFNRGPEGAAFLLALSDEKGTPALALLDLAKGKRRLLLKNRYELIRGGSGALGLNAEGDRLLFCPRVDGRYILAELRDTRPGAKRPFSHVQLRTFDPGLEELETPAYLPDGRVILAGRRGGEPWSLYELDLGTGKKETLFASTQSCTGPCPIPGTTLLAYVRQEGDKKALMLRDLSDGTESVLVQHPGLLGVPRSSPTGDKLVFSAAFEGSPDLYIIEIPGGRLARATRVASGALSPCWVEGPAGLRLAFVAYEEAKTSIHIHASPEKAADFALAPALPEGRPPDSPKGPALASGKGLGLPAPMGLKVRAGNASALLSWERPPGVAAVRVLRSEDGRSWSTVYTTAGPGETSWLDTHLENGTSYRYCLASLRGEEAGPSSEAVEVQPRLRVVEKPYKSRLSPDLVFVLAGFDSHAGLVGAGILTMSDMLGDKRVALAGDSFPEVRRGGTFTYEDLGGRLDWGLSLFSMDHQYLILDPSSLNVADQLREEQYGGSLFGSLPLDRWHRLEAGLEARRVTGGLKNRTDLFARDLVEDMLVEGQSRSLRLAFVRERTVYGGFQPIRGDRALIQAVASAPILGGKVESMDGMAELQLFRPLPLIKPTWALATRLLGVSSSGPSAVRYYLGGDGTLRGYAFGDIRGHYAVSGTAELRAPLFEDIRVGLWPLQFLSMQQVQLAGFVDGALVGDRAEDMALARRAVGAGGGLRILFFLFERQPVLLRLDLARRTDRNAKPILHISLRDSF